MHAATGDAEPRDGTLPSRTRVAVAVVGGGIAGLTAARAIGRATDSMVVYDKARGPGGRASTRRHGTMRFDHGAQYFTVRDPRFEEQVRDWRARGTVAEWQGRIGVANGELREKTDQPRRFVGVPGMNALGQDLATGSPVRLDCRVEGLERTGGGWLLRGARFTCEAEAVLLALPAPQAAVLLASTSLRPAFRSRVERIKMAPCWAAMLRFGSRLPIAFDGLFVEGGPLTWAARNGSKPGRPADESWVLHASAEWTGDRLEADAESVGRALLDGLREACGTSLPSPHFLTAHRWLYSQATRPLDDGFLWDEQLDIGACGDWCHGSRVEGAYLSGLAAGRHVYGRFA